MAASPVPELSFLPAPPHRFSAYVGGEKKGEFRDWTSCHAERQRPIFGAKIEAWKHKMVHIFHFLQTGMVFEIVNPFS